MLSFPQLWDKENMKFTKWISFCTSIAEPTRDLPVDALWNTDLAVPFVISRYRNWEKFYDGLLP